MSEEIKKEKFYCVFGIGEREFLIPKDSVVQILDITRIFPIPGSPDYIVGALPVRGKIIPAIDLAKIFNIERLGYSDNKLLVVEAKGEKLGILSDITPFFVSFDPDIVVEDFIDPDKLFDQLKVNSKKNSEKSNA
ncbi:chemotaxis protein CheW [Thermodesulfovibrio sp.]|jgi:purine-binding chemotaxis protein CheW|uniref:chemotaxis protein CheW n=1 Tax=Thermodesulfovibrio TaxID=28261 RepID=UPI00262E9B2F|nr:chemotaxis protein CheW [Thermodesulfovibrio sp.]